MTTSQDILPTYRSIVQLWLYKTIFFRKS